MRSAKRWTWIAAPLVLACGCIGNIGDRDRGGAPGIHGPDSTPEVACPSTGPTPLRRLGQAEYANTVLDLFGVTFDATQVDADEKVGAFVSNSHASVSLSSL